MTAPLRSGFVMLAALAAGAALPSRAAAQLQTPPIYEEYRVDAIANRNATLQAGGGVVFPLGIYVRLGVDGAAGATWRDGGPKTSGRVDGIARFTLDPFREIPVAISVGGGVSVPYVASDAHVRPLLVTVVDVEGKRHGAWTPALQVGLGGGVRVGVVMRNAPIRYR